MLLCAIVISIPLIFRGIFFVSKGDFMKNSNLNLKAIAKLGILCAISIVLVYFIHFPIFPAVGFLEYDPADISILIGTFTFGPIAGLLLTVVVSFIQGFTVSASSSIYGVIMHIIATGTLSLVSGLIYNKKKTKKRAAIALGLGTLAMVFVMFFANLVITPLFMGGVTVDVVLGLMPFILGFNAIKAGINSILTFFLYKRISKFIRK